MRNQREQDERTKNGEPEADAQGQESRKRGHSTFLHDLAGSVVPGTEPGRPAKTRMSPFLHARQRMAW